VVACGDRDAATPGAVDLPAFEGPAPDASAIFALFDAPTAASTVAGRAALRTEILGSLEIPAGVLAISDAFINDYPIRIEGLPPGKHTVEGLVATADEDQRIAAARIVVKGGTPTRWKEEGWFPVDGGTASFFDASLGKAISAENIQAFSQALIKGLEASDRPPLFVTSLSWRGSDLVAFGSGFGDGSYPVFVGAAESGEVMAVLIDFMILPWP
jgi:hypothetical protein